MKTSLAFALVALLGVLTPALADIPAPKPTSITVTNLSAFPQYKFSYRAGDPKAAAKTIVDGQSFTALNAGPAFKFNEAISFQVNCDSQQEVDHFWNKLSDGGDPQAQQCGWLKDRYGVSWQVVPRVLPEMLMNTDSDKSQRVMAALLQMKKLDIVTLQQAYDSATK